MSEPPAGFPYGAMPSMSRPISWPKSVRLSMNGSTFTAATPAGTFTVESRLVGEHNVYNLLGAIGVALHGGATCDQVREAVARVINVPGRFERVSAGQDFTVVVDYAHTEDALVRLLTAAQTLKTGGSSPYLDAVVTETEGNVRRWDAPPWNISDVVILTSDNPRTEDPLAILGRWKSACARRCNADRHVQYHMVPDRREAIGTAVRLARPGDIVLIAGKGHEDYQIIGTKKVHFDDREVARDAIQQLRKNCA